jgi:hypothetical protein
MNLGIAGAARFHTDVWCLWPVRGENPPVAYARCGGSGPASPRYSPPRWWR